MLGLARLHRTLAGAVAAFANYDIEEVEIDPFFRMAVKMAPLVYICQIAFSRLPGMPFFVLQNTILIVLIALFVWFLCRFHTYTLPKDAEAKAKMRQIVQTSGFDAARMPTAAINARASRIAATMEGLTKQLRVPDPEIRLATTAVLFNPVPLLALPSISRFLAAGVATVAFAWYVGRALSGRAALLVAPYLELEERMSILASKRDAAAQVPEAFQPRPTYAFSTASYAAPAPAPMPMPVPVPAPAQQAYMNPYAPPAAPMEGSLRESHLVPPGFSGSSLKRTPVKGSTSAPRWSGTAPSPSPQRPRLYVSAKGPLRTKSRESRPLPKRTSPANPFQTSPRHPRSSGRR
eukprot:gnl/Chilomastix_cuspidata/4148.p1 GENE.gnl/Chilomastix_cuspidata/4148~~gnl/Chilomastix_cuspidata/4148.p1  ORF type:complete len:349 (+),score=70.37 gnl/Chilomastix_cuspidata/4148:329-1375(+)